MDKSSLFSALSLVSVFIYMYIGLYTLGKIQNQLFIEFFFYYVQVMPFGLLLMLLHMYQRTNMFFLYGIRYLL